MEKTIENFSKNVIEFVDNELVKEFTPLEKGAYAVACLDIADIITPKNLKMFLNDRDNVDIDKVEKYLREFIAKAEVIELEGVKIPKDKKVKEKEYLLLLFNCDI